ncbi:hypothetical protein [Sneathiella limimaris]|uniref:hypothetical protein n=1 Tax=Sneathiella limimaris TaxID=1964213 RepID=UPI001469DA72|nr:hypothetical protein [Sneathiella limimaris]
MTEEDIPNTTFLKWVVAILGILIIAVASAIGVILYKRATKATSEMMSETPAPQAPISQAGEPFGVMALTLPEGAKVIRTEVASGRIVVSYGTGPLDISGIYILDVASGAVLGQYTFN